MASMAGPRAGGTDGSDWNHREKVAHQYVVSVKFKTAMRRTILYHGMFGLCAGLGSLMYGIMALNCWQLLWLISAPTCLIGFRGICKNSTISLVVYKICLLGSAIPACLWALTATGGFVPHFEIYQLLGAPKHDLLMPHNNLAIYFVVITALMSHFYSLICINKLTHAWDVTARRPAKKSE